MCIGVVIRAIRVNRVSLAFQGTQGLFQLFVGLAYVPSFRRFRSKRRNICKSNKDVVFENKDVEDKDVEDKINVTSTEDKNAEDEGVVAESGTSLGEGGAGVIGGVNGKVGGVGATSLS